MHARFLNESLATLVSSFLTRTLSEKPNLQLIICGLAFKGIPKTNDTRDSFAIQLLSNISKEIKSGRVKIWDPHVSQVERGKFEFEFIESMPIEDPLICVLTNNALFLRSDFPGSVYSFLKKDSIIVDLWGNISLDTKLEAKLISLGRKSWSEVVHAK